MASDSQKLFSEIEQAQDDLRESIETSRRLCERSDALIRRVKDQAPDLAGGGSRAVSPGSAPPAPAGAARPTASS